MLQEGEIQRVGSDRLQRVDVRIVAATNRNLRQEVAQGRFREDLYHRLSVFPLKVPALRERGQDILLLAEFFLERLQYRLNIQKLLLTPQARTLLLNYSWPGNVRELEHVLSRAALRAHQQQPGARLLQIAPRALGIAQPVSAPAVDPAPAGGMLGQSRASLAERTRRYQSDLIREALAAHQGNVAAAARELQTDRSNLARLIKRLGIRL